MNTNSGPLSADDVAKFCGCSPYTVIGWIRRGRKRDGQVVKLDAHKPGQHYRITRTALRRFLGEATYQALVEDQIVGQTTSRPGFALPPAPLVANRSSALEVRH